MSAPGSAVIGVLSRAIEVARIAYAHSAARRVWADVSAPPGARRRAGVTTIAASATALLLQPIATAPAPFIWIVPACGVLAGAMLLFAAGDALD